MEAQSTFRFLDLPAELRIKVYNAINMNNAVPMSMFKGLYWSCRQVKDEMHYECTQKMESMVTAAATSGALHLDLTLYGDFEAVREVVVGLDAAVFDRKGPIDHMPIVRLAELPLEVLGIVISDQATTISSVQRRILRFVKHCCLGISHSSAVRVPTLQFEDSNAVRTAGAKLKIYRLEDAKNWDVVAEHELVSGRLLLSGATINRRTNSLELRERLQKEILERNPQFE